MGYYPRDYQASGIDEIVEYLRGCAAGDRRMYCGPCGTGKSIVEVGVQQALGDTCWITTPRVEIIDQLIEKGGNRERIGTPIVLRNRMLDGSIVPPRYIIVDEGHHDSSATANEVRLCAGEPPTVAFTATPYRGTPQGTAALRELYGAPRWLITLPDAVARGFVTIPDCRTVPVLDDDLVEITNGEFSVRQIERKTVWGTCTSLVRGLWERDRRSTMCSLPTVSSCHELSEQLGHVGIRCDVVTAETGRDSRRAAFDRSLACEAVLLQVQVVSEGVDLPLRRLIDFAPTMSPVRWLQQVGRIMRPGGVSEYVCCNRNLLRHGYLLEGLIPSDVFVASQQAFPAPSKRVGIRAFGLEGVGRLKAAPVPLASGLTAHAYYVTKSTGHAADQFACIVLPNQAEPLWATKCKKWNWEKDGTCTVDYGRWTRCPAPSELTGFASVPPKPLSPKQAAKWKQLANHVGLNSDAEVDSKSCQAMFVLLDTKVRIQ